MTIFEHAKDYRLNRHQGRLTILQECGAPDVILEHERHQVKRWKEMTLDKLKGAKEYATVEMTSVVEKKGRGGKSFYLYNGTIALFCHPMYGFKFKIFEPYKR